jgi:DNA ligase-1
MTALGRLVDTSERISASSARSVKVRELAGLLATLAPAEISPSVHYLAGELPQGAIGIGAAALRSAAGEPAAMLPGLSISDVGDTIDELARIRGAGSAVRREAVLRNLFARATLGEQHFLLRLLLGELRQGALGGLMIDAIAVAAGIPVAAVRRAAMYAGGLGAVARASLLEGADALARFKLTLFAPVEPMLAQTATDVAAALAALGGTAALEWKMDGARVQAHKQGGDVRLYSRALNEVTAAVPEITERLRALPEPSFVLDGEAIAFGTDGRPRPFQITMRRFGRRLDIEALRRELPMQVFFFDALAVAGERLVDRPTRERIEALHFVVPEEMRVPRLVTADPAAASAFYDAALAAGHEGVMAKSLEAPYEAGNRGAGWLKIKRAHTLDLVVLAAEWGHGRRTGRLSNLHLGAFDPASGEWVMLGKTFKGLTDALLAWQTEALLAREVRRDEWTVTVRPELVVEIAFSDLQVSARYPGGLALRLARVKRYREDKRAEQADTMDSVRRIFAAQNGTGGT